jgi:hypothetical protein
MKLFPPLRIADEQSPIGVEVVCRPRICADSGDENGKCEAEYEVSSDYVHESSGAIFKLPPALAGGKLKKFRALAKKLFIIRHPSHIVWLKP